MKKGMAGRAALGLAMVFMIPLLPMTASADGLDDWLTGETVTGDWGGLRGKLEDAGIDLADNNTPTALVLGLKTALTF